MINKRPLGTTGIELTEIGFGASGFWGDRLFDERQASEVINAVAASGIRYLDTGSNYSGFNAEPRLGRCLQSVFNAVPREQWVISSKGGTLTAAGSAASAFRTEQKDFSPDAVSASVHRSIRQIGCDYLDIFFLHGCPPHDGSEALLRRLQDLRQNGWIRAVGINTHTAADMQWLASRREVFDAALIDYSAVARDREPLIEHMHGAGIGVIAGTVLAQGHLLPPRGLRRGADLWYAARNRIKPSARALARTATGVRQLLAEQTEMSPAQAAFAYVLGNPRLTSAVFGSTQVANVMDIATSAGRALSEDLRQRIRQS